MGDSGTRIVRAALLGLVLLAGSAQAGTVLTLSDLSSDETNPDVLNATLVFSVLGSELTLAVTNDTPAVGGFDIDAVYFNSTSEVQDLVLTPDVPGWTLVHNEAADGFGRFDYALMTASGNDLLDLAPGESLTFTFEILGNGPFLETCLTTDSSQIPPGEHPTLAAAKFMSGPGGDSAFGAVIPEPHTGLLILIGVGLLGRRKRRQL
jgi:hypothetical protein